MRKKDELADPTSCLNRARDDEWLFTLLGRDEAAPDTVRYWIQKRLALKKNQAIDPQIQEAVAWIQNVIAENGHANFENSSAGALAQAVLEERERLARRVEEQIGLLNSMFPEIAGRHDAVLTDIARMIRTDPFLEMPPLASRPEITAPIAGLRMAEARKCERAGCGATLPEGWPAVYCSNECALADA